MLLKIIDDILDRFFGNKKSKIVEEPTILVEIKTIQKRYADMNEFNAYLKPGIMEAIKPSKIKKPEMCYVCNTRPCICNGKR